MHLLKKKEINKFRNMMKPLDEKIHELECGQRKKTRKL